MGDVYDITCEGRVVNSDTPYDGASAYINFEEWSSRRELPERDYFGEFNYDPNSYGGAHFNFSLRHVADNASDRLLPLLRQNAEAKVFLTISLVNEEEEFQAATDGLVGKVFNYKFEVQKRLVQESLPAKQETLDIRDSATEPDDNLEESPPEPREASLSRVQATNTRRNLPIWAWVVALLVGMMLLSNLIAGH